MASAVDVESVAVGGCGPVDSYGVLVSEIMCQQTRVSAVIPHYLRWMERFPTAAALASADDAVVRQYWSGLGFYRRAKGLHNSAKEATQRHGGRVPTDRDELLTLPGVGPYTAGAVASIAGGQAVAAVDGNVIRVFSRLTLAPCRSDDKAVHRACWARAAELHAAAAAASQDPTLGSPGDLNQAIMELGATVCTPKAPMCAACPLRTHCAAATAAGTDIEDLAGRLQWTESQRQLMAEAGGGAAFEPAHVPCKPSTKLPRVQLVASLPVFGLQGPGREPTVWLTRRQRDGLLSGQWAPPSTVLAEWRPHKGEPPVVVGEAELAAEALLARDGLRAQLPPCLLAGVPLNVGATVRDEYKFSGCTHQLHIAPLSAVPQAAAPLAAAGEGLGAAEATGRWFSMSQLRSEAALSTWACRVLGQALLPRLAAACKSGFFKVPAGGTAGTQERIHAAFRTLLRGDGAAAANWLIGRGRLAAARDKLLGKPKRKAAAPKRRAAPKRTPRPGAAASSAPKRRKEEEN